jgi:glycerol-3-phosphate dehydrogenase (NAD(P)+)
MAIESGGVIGGGAWGTALAQTLRLAGRHVVLWAREPETVEDINVRHVNRTFLPGISLDPDLTATSALADVAKSDAVLMVAPDLQANLWSVALATPVLLSQVIGWRRARLATA